MNETNQISNQILNFLQRRLDFVVELWERERENNYITYMIFYFILIYFTHDDEVWYIFLYLNDIIIIIIIRVNQ